MTEQEQERADQVVAELLVRAERCVRDIMTGVFGVEMSDEEVLIVALKLVQALPRKAERKGVDDL